MTTCDGEYRANLYSHKRAALKSLSLACSFSLTNVAGSSFDKTGAPLRGIISSPSMQLPWAWGRFDWPKASYKGDMPLLLLHKEPLTHAGGFDSYGGVLTHVPERADGSARLNARFWMVCMDWPGGRLAGNVGDS